MNMLDSLVGRSLTLLLFSLCASSQPCVCCFSAVMANPLRFQGNSLLQWNNLEAATAAASVLWHVELMFRTRQSSATLLHVSSSLQHNLTLQVRADAVDKSGQQHFLASL